jgi:hypothetical protein
MCAEPALANTAPGLGTYILARGAPTTILPDPTATEVPN